MNRHNPYPDAHRRAARAYQKRNRESGRCTQCPRPAFRHQRCAACWLKMRALKLRGGSSYACSKCGDGRHNARTHDLLQLALAIVAIEAAIVARLSEGNT